jgi:hypothetical protein
MKRQMTHLQHRVSLLEMDPNTVKKLTPSQAVQLRDFMRHRLTSLDQVNLLFVLKLTLLRSSQNKKQYLPLFLKSPALYAFPTRQ